MNRIFQTQWSCQSQCWKAVPETAKSSRKGRSDRPTRYISSGFSASMILGLAFGSGGIGAQSPPAMHALPQGGVVAHGAATIAQTVNAQAASMTVRQTSQAAVINWQNFNLGQAARLEFDQPNA